MIVFLTNLFAVHVTNRFCYDNIKAAVLKNYFFCVYINTMFRNLAENEVSKVNSGFAFPFYKSFKNERNCGIL